LARFLLRESALSLAAAHCAATSQVERDAWLSLAAALKDAVAYARFAAEPDFRHL
jgi:hypothetical protein